MRTGLIAAAALIAASAAVAQDYEKYSQVGYYDQAGDVIAHQQSWRSPLGLSKVAQVQVGGSDEAAADFQTNYLPSITGLLNQQLGESVVFDNQATLALDPSKLTLATESTARAYFIGEGAGYHNSLGFNTIAPGTGLVTDTITSNAQLIFPDASTPGSVVDPLSTARQWNAPLIQGDFVDLGTFSAGSTLDFFLIANGANGGSTTYTAGTTRNPDQINHVVAFAVPDSPFLIIGFEDLFGGGDEDYNDLLFAIDIGATNLQRLVSTPEPGTWALMVSFLAFGLWSMSRRRSVSVALDTN
jgi:hypothetical protein